VAPVSARCRAAGRLLACHWPMIAAVTVFGLAPHPPNAVWTWMQIISTVFLAWALRQFEREVMAQAALRLYGPRRVLRRSPHPGGGDR
jgi:hypothetical protein